jgi:hypothetical protein
VRCLLLSPSPLGARVIISSLQTARQLSAIVAKSTTNFPKLPPPHTPFTPFSSPKSNTHSTLDRPQTFVFFSYKLTPLGGRFKPRTCELQQRLARRRTHRQRIAFSDSNQEIEQQLTSTYRPQGFAPLGYVSRSPLFTPSPKDDFCLRRKNYTFERTAACMLVQL